MTGVEFRILGPLEARREGAVVALGGTRQRAVLALLLTRANEVVSAERLIDELWGGEPPGTAANVLQGYVSHLRKALGAEVIVTRPSGYVVEIEAGQLDLDRFERLCEEARAALGGGDGATASELLREALALWRGQPLADFAYEPFAQAEIARLEELRLAAVERRIEADLARGRDAELIGELEGLIERHPLRERLRGDLMLALYRAGRQADALEAYRKAREALVDELGIDPSPALQELERAILRQDPSLDPAPAAVAVSVLAGVEHELEFPDRSLLVVPDRLENLPALIALAEPLSRKPRREIVIAALVPEPELARTSGALEAQRAALVSRGVPSRAAAFTSLEPARDIITLAVDQETDLLLVDAPEALARDGAVDTDLGVLLADMPCDIGMLVAPEPLAIGPDRPVLVPFGGVEHEWAAVELGAWIAKAHGSRLRLLGVEADVAKGRRDASKLLARAALMVQRVAAVSTEPQLIPPGDASVIEASAGAGLMVVGISPRWRQEGLGAVRLAVVRGATAPVLLARRGLRPGGLAPKGTMTRFTWTIGAAG